MAQRPLDWDGKEGWKGHAGEVAGADETTRVKPSDFVFEETKPMLASALDQRPLIDKLQEATFGNATPMQYVSDKYALRMILRKAHCFNIDSITSALISDFSVAIVQDLEAARHLAIPPFPITWFEIDNVARLNRLPQLGVSLSRTASGDDVCKKIGWLITPTMSGYCASYATEFYDGMFVAPVSFHWSTDDKPCDANVKAIYSKEFEKAYADYNLTATRLCFGVNATNVSTEHATFGPANFQGDLLYFRKTEADLMKELWGELRHIWGLLVALGTATVETSKSAKHEIGPVVMMKGKPLLPLEHKTLTVHLGKKRTVTKTVEKALHGIRMRWHEVRAHTRLLKSGQRVPVKSHSRGDESLGKITKTYLVEK